MKAVVVEIKDGYAALLQDDGLVVKVKNRNYKIGDVVNMREKTSVIKRKFGVVVAAAAMFFMLMGAGVWAYATPYYYVSLDINPSVLMEVNMFERVIGTEALNEDGEKVLEGLQLENQDIEEAIATTTASIAEAGYLEEGGEILIASTSENSDKAEQLADKLKGKVEEEVAQSGKEAKVAAEAVGYSMVQEAKALGITPGKYNIITKLLGENVDGKNINESIKDLMARYTATKGAEGKGKAAEAAKNKMEEDSDLADKAEQKEQNAAGKAEQASKQQGNAKVETPAAENKSPNAGAMENNAANKRPSTPVESTEPNKPTVPETPVGGRP